MDRPDDRDLISVDYYLGAFGPTIRLHVLSVARLNELKGIFLLLAEGSVQEVDLAQRHLSKTAGLNSLILKFVSEGQTKEKNLVLIKDEFQRLNFIWSGFSEHWLTCAGLVDGLVGSDQPGHQYLTAEGIGDALVELAYME